MNRPSPEEIVRYMMSRDAFSRWLGIELVDIRLGYCVLSMAIRPDMTNGFGIAHGGIIYSLADSAMAFAANTYGRVAKTVQLNCHYIKALNTDDVVQAVASVTEQSHRLSYMDIVVSNKSNKIATLHGLAYVSDKLWVIPPTASEIQQTVTD